MLREVMARGSDVTIRLRSFHLPHVFLAFFLAILTLFIGALHFLMSSITTLVATIKSVNITSRLRLSNWERFDSPEAGRKKELLKVLSESDDYTIWNNAALELDKLEGKEEWKKRDETHLYDYKLIRGQLLRLRELSHKNDIHILVAHLRACLLRNLGGCGKRALYGVTHTGTKYLIDNYVEEVEQQLEYICNSEFDDDFPIQPKLDFFYETRHAYGRSALLLSGGAGLGVYHLGVVKALFEERLLPRVISGSSVGSLFAAIVCTHTDAELPSYFQSGKLHFDVFDKIEKGALKRKLNRLFTQGVLQDITKLEALLRTIIGDITFKEAYDRTNRILNVTVGSVQKGFDMPRLLNYLTAPNVLIWSAACASCAFPGLYEPVELKERDPAGGPPRSISPMGYKWSDGSIESDLPMARLAELFNINHFIVSQVNPHVAPLLRHVTMPGSSWLLSTILSLIGQEIKLLVTQLGELGIIRSAVLHGMVAQPFEGDITIVPDITLEDLSRIIQNPTEDWRMRCQHKAQNNTFPFMSMIKNRLRVELCLEKCVRSLRSKASTMANNRNLSFILYHDQA